MAVWAARLEVSVVLYYKFARAQLTSKGWVGSKAGGQCGVIMLICTCTGIMWLVHCMCTGDVEGVGREQARLEVSVVL